VDTVPNDASPRALHPASRPAWPSAAVFSNEMRLLSRDRMAVVWLLVGPILCITVITAARYEPPGGTQILLPVVDEDQGPIAKGFVKLLREHANVVQTSRAEAESLVRDDNQAAAAIVFPPGLSKRYLQGRPGEIELLTDPAEVVGLQRVKLTMMLMDREAASLADPIAEPRLKFDEHNLTGGHLSRKSHEQNVPGFTIMFMLLAVVYGTSTSLQHEAMSGTGRRILIAPIGFGRAILAKLAARHVVGCTQMLALLLWGHFIFGISLGSSWWALFAVVAATVLNAVALGALVAGLAGTEEQTLPISLAVVLLVSAVGGLWWPLSGQPSAMRSVAVFLPSTWAMRGMTNLVLRDRGFAAVLPSVGVLLLQGGLLLVLGVITFRRRWAAR
jgi:linearmycin/streptolysin S transport system permease protein